MCVERQTIYLKCRAMVSEIIALVSIKILKRDDIMDKTISCVIFTAFYQNNKK